MKYLVATMLQSTYTAITLSECLYLDLSQTHTNILISVLLFCLRNRPFLWLQSPAAWSWTRHLIFLSLPYIFICLIYMHVTIYITFLEQTVPQQ